MPWENKKTHKKPIFYSHAAIPTMIFHSSFLCGIWSCKQSSVLTKLYIWNSLDSIFFTQDSSGNGGSTSWIIFVWPTLFDSTSLDGSFNLESLCSFFFQLWTVSPKCLPIDLKSEINSKQKLHLQSVQLCRAYSSHFSIVCIIEESAIPCCKLLSEFLAKTN